MYSGLGEALKGVYVAMITALIIFVPLGVWKAFDLIKYVYDHSSFTWK